MLDLLKNADGLVQRDEVIIAMDHQSAGSDALKLFIGNFRIAFQLTEVVELFRKDGALVLPVQGLQIIVTELIFGRAIRRNEFPDLPAESGLRTYSNDRVESFGMHCGGI